jgi:hypothetical protein
MYIYIYNIIYFSWLCSPARFMASSFTRFLDHTQRRATVGRTPMDEWSVRRKDLYLTTCVQHTQQTNIHAPGGIRTHDRSKRAVVDPRIKNVRSLWSVYIIYLFIYLFLTTIGSTPGGSNTVHIYTQTVHRIQRTVHKKRTHLGSAGRVPSWKLYSGICLTTEEKARKNLS